MRDNTAVAALRARGRDVHLVPVYTPIRTDETDVSEHRIFYGGINVYLQQKSAFFRHTPRLIDGLLEFAGVAARCVALGGTGPRRRTSAS